MKRYITFFLLLAILVPGIAQRRDTTQLIYPIPVDNGDPVERLYNQSPLYFQDPSNITHEIIYDPLTGQYTFKDKIGDFEYTTPTTMSQSDFIKYKNRQGVMDYWKERRKRDASSTSDGNSIIPPLYVGGEAFDMIFGSNTIDIRPQGSVDLTFGIKHNYRGDPAMTDRQKNQTNFDFDQDIQLNVIAKIGDKINFNINKNTKATFNYEDLMKLKYEGKEDEIIQLLEAGNVSFPLNSTLITGTQQLFGLKSKLKFGKTTVTGIVSYQESESRNIAVQGGAQTNEFNLSCLDYEENRHFFLSQYFRDQYEGALSTLPTVTSSINITKIEVWVTNTNSSTQDTRNILALTDLAEGKDQWIYSDEVSPANTTVIYPRNAANDMLTRIDTTQIRSISSVTNYMTGDPLRIGRQAYMASGRDFEKIENARRLSTSEYTLNSKLGFISLNVTLNSNQSLAVAYQYTIVGSSEIYQVGEFSDQGINTPQVLVAKLLRGTTVNTSMPIWDLMMKNVYNIKAYQISATDFMLNIFYNGNSNSTPMGYFTEGPKDVKGVSLLHLMNLDNLTQQNNPIPGGDGVFDFLNGAQTSGGTINSSNGRIYFPVLEPFGSHMHEVFAEDPDLGNKYAFDSLYTMTKTSAEQYSEKNKFTIQGYYSSQSGGEISLNAMNVAQGSVTVTAGGRTLTENVDYTVDYTLGRVSIINEGILNSGTPINISLESNSGFSALKKTFLGSRIEHEFNPDFRLGGTILYLGEKSYTQKINYGEEAIANTIYGFDMSYHTEARWLTNFIDKLPGISTKTPSRINFDGEFARFIPGLSKSASERGTSYIDDFEGAKSTIDLRMFGQWHLASTPQNQTDLFPEAASNTGLSYGMNRAKLAWYTIDHNVFYDRNGTIRPRNITSDELSKHSVRQVLENEIFPTKDIAAGTPTNISVLNLAYYPSDKGPYNYDVLPDQYSAGVAEDGSLNRPEDRWAGIMRKMETTDFEATNIEYVEFWLMDPFADPEYQNNPGKLYINLGDISEDILRDGRKFYENGLPESDNVVNVDTTIWGRVPTMQDLVGAFSTNPDARQYQDVGFDGLRDTDERTFFEDNYLSTIRNQFGESSEVYQKAYNDPSSDNYHYFRSSEWNDDELHSSILERYKNYNGVEGNSPSESQRVESYTTSNTTLPDGEDINTDNTLSESERYYQYEIDLDPSKMVVGKNHIADIYEANNIVLANGEISSVKWYQFRVPIKQPDKVIGRIDDYSSIRFMRMFVRGFHNPIVLRFATLDLVKGEWRTYTQNIQAPGEYQPNDVANATSLDVSAVNIEENGRRSPVPYVIPPGITQEQLVGTTAVTKLNEQSLQLTVQNLVDGDGRAIYKTTDFDLRQYKYLKMFVHAEKANEEDIVNDQDLTVFMRLGTDFTENYYEYEIPLKMTPWYTAYTNKEAIWPEINNLDILLEDLVTVKQNRNAAMNQPGSDVKLNFIYSERFKKGTIDGKDYYHTIKVIGNPSISDVEAMMIGVRNPKRQQLDNSNNDDGESKSVVIWINELRLTELSSNGGYAGTGRLEATLADLGRVVVSGAYSSGGFGALDSDITSNTFEANSQFSVSTDLELGKFVENTGLRLPLHVDYGRNVTTPLYNPYDPDIKLHDALAIMNTQQERDSLTSIVHNMTQYKNINLMNVRKERTMNKKKKKEETGNDEKPKSNPRDPNNMGRGSNVPTVHIYDIENFNLSFSYSETNQENTDIDYYNVKTYRGSLGYNYVGNPKNVAPFSQKKWASKSYLGLIKDINFYYLPKSITFNTQMYRYYSEKLLRNKSGGEIIINPTYSKQWDWDRNFQFRYDLSRGLSLEYAAETKAYVYEPAGNPDKGTEEWQLNRDTIKNELMHLGTMSRYHQTVNVNYTVPINKLPLLNWVTANASYQGQYFWTASAVSIQDRLGNTIENTHSIQGNASLDFTKIYNTIPYLKKLNTTAKRNNKPNVKNNNKKDDEKGGKKQVADSTDTKPSVNVGKVILDGSLRLVTLVKKASVTYSMTGGQVLPGFMPKARFLGMDSDFTAPGWAFVAGAPGQIFDKAVDNGWLTRDSILSEPYINRSSQTLNYRVNCEPFYGFKLDIQGNRTYAENFQQYFRANSAGDFEVFTPTNGGNFSISTMLIKTAFVKEYDDGNTDVSTNVGSPLFDQMLANRSIIADRIARNNPQWMANVQEYYFDTITGDRYPKGYNSSNMEVLLYSFLAAYSGTDAAKIELTPFQRIPFPNWNLTYNGLTNIPAIASIFKSVNITHTYRSTYSLSNWASNVYYDESNPIQTFENSDNIIPRYDITQLVLNEQFMPLIGVDVGFQNTLTANVQYKKSRAMTISFSNNQLTEVNGHELVVGAGYRIKGLKFNVSSLTATPGNRNNKKTVQNDLVLKVDIGFRHDKTILRRIDENNNQVSAGQDKINIYVTADYQFSTRLSAQAFFKRDMSTPFINTSFPTATTFAGVLVRFNLAQ